MRLNKIQMESMTQMASNQAVQKHLMAMLEM
jgi:hypothetical protein